MEGVVIRGTDKMPLSRSPHGTGLFSDAGADLMPTGICPRHLGTITCNRKLIFGGNPL